MAASGYITLPRELLENEELMLGHRLKVLMYLASNARWNYNPDTFEIRGVRVTINRGQFAESYIQMAIDVKIGKRQMLSVLSELEQCGFIEVDRSNVINVYTIVDYNKFCSSSTELQKGQPYNNSNNNVNKGEEMNNTTNARTCERDDEKFFAKMRQSFTAWQADACRVLKIDQETLTRYIEEFQIECRAKDSTHIDWKDITTHFFSWGRYHKEGEEKQLKQESYGNNNANSQSNSRRYWYEPTGEEDYSGDTL